MSTKIPQSPIAWARSFIYSTLAGKGAFLVGLSNIVRFAATNVFDAISALVSHNTETYYASDYPWLIVPNSASDQSAAMQAAHDYVKTVGGTLKYPPGTYLGRINFSGNYLAYTMDGQGATFRPFVATQGEVFYCKNSATYPTISGQFGFIPVKFVNVNVMGRLTSAASDTDINGHCDYAVNFICSSAKWYDSSWQYGRIAAYYGYYHQYGEFYSCLIGAAVYANGTGGMILDGNTSAESSNENRFYGPKLFSCKNGLIIKGGAKNRINNPTIQDTRAGGTAGIWLTADASGFGADGTEITGAYLEINAVPGITVGVAPNTSINGAELLSGTESITSTHCYNLALRDINGYGGGSVTLNHPAGNSDTASVIVHGGNISPSFGGLIHSGPTNISIDQPGLVVKPLAKTGQGAVPFLSIDTFGVKAGILRATATGLFTINQLTFATSTYRYEIFELTLFGVLDVSAVSNYGYSSRIQRCYLFVSNNNGVLQAFVSATIDGADMGVNTAFTAPGVIAVTTSVVADTVTVLVNFPGAGTSAATTSQMSVGYHIRGITGNPVTLTRL
jgi:hypothetical protein